MEVIAHNPSDHLYLCTFQEKTCTYFVQLITYKTRNGAVNSYCLIGKEVAQCLLMEESERK